MSSCARQIRGPLAAVGFILAAAAADSGLASTVTYAYDATGRLVSSTRTVGLTEQYGFDNADNRSTLNTSRQGSGNTAPQAAAIQPTAAAAQAASAQPTATPSTQTTTAPAQNTASTGP